MKQPTKPPPRNPWPAYERAKQAHKRALELGQITPKEYERRIKALTKRLGI